ncbi:hypothetical protein A946_08810 [Methylacidiphilum kamchatkense Kam1]|uniref:Uncharacterized protein n=1 Tax=Methylacidiphilum kamchatkense Kam1 TaxID=1202785 RepID=A0ABR4ZX28_9BACT|nr:hypothetical protein A946_08810 [Methylacidiphilum kamchatkense Kam1]
MGFKNLCKRRISWIQTALVGHGHIPTALHVARNHLVIVLVGAEIAKLLILQQEMQSVDIKTY